jgi:hypothetical protein
MLKRILLCTTHHSAPTTTKSFTHARLFTLFAVVLLMSVAGWAQAAGGNAPTNACGAVSGGFTSCSLSFGNGQPGGDSGWITPATEPAIDPGNSLPPVDLPPGQGIPSTTFAEEVGNRFMQFFRDEVIAWHQNYNSNQSVMSITAVGEAWNPANQSLTHPRIAIGIVPFEGPELPGAGEAPWSETDVIFGLDPEGARQLKTFQQEVGGGGGKRIVQIWNGRGDVGHVIDQEIRVRALGAPGKIRFNLDGIEGLRDSNGAYGPNAPIWNLAAQEARYGTATTAWELLGVKVWWRTGALSYDNVTFYLKGKPTSAPW